MKAPPKTWHVLDIINWSSNFLSDKGIDSHRLNAEQLLGHTLNMDRVQLYLNYDRPLIQDELAHFKKLLKRRLRNEPLQYILGQTEFMSLPFVVNPSVLIPRPETEVLVETVLVKCKQQFTQSETIRILDIGTGSGCIAVSLAKYLAAVQITALDVSREAIKVASENAQINGVADKIQFLPIDFFNSTELSKVSNKFDVIVSNPPYISTHDFSALPEEIKNYEPVIALKDNHDGMSFYRRLAETAACLLNESGFIVVEVGEGQANFVRKICKSNYLNNIQIFKDLNGIERTIYCGI